LVFRQTVATTSAFTPKTWSLNSNDPTAFDYAILDQLESYRLTTGPSKGSFQFKITWAHTTPNEWIQTSNPTTSATVTGYQPVSVSHNDNNWAGLASNGVNALLDGSLGDLWFYAIGVFNWWGAGIPAGSDAAQVVELFVWDDTGASVPNYAAGPVVSTGQYYLVARQTVPQYFTANQWSFNSADPSNFNFLNLDQLAQYQNNGKFTFRLSWPGAVSQDWSQTSNPISGTSVTGYVGINVTHTAYSWGGLHADNQYALLSGSTQAGYWWYAVGSFSNFQGGIPGFQTPVQVVQLYALKANNNPI